MDTLLTLSKESLAQAGSNREMGARLLGRLLTRPDTEFALSSFFEWVFQNLNDKTPKSVFSVPGKFPASSAQADSSLNDFLLS